MEEEQLIGKTLLVVDDEVDLRDIMASELEFMGAKVFQAGNVATAKEVLKNNNIDLIISDIRMPGGTGIDLLEFVKARNPNTPPVILITGFADITIEDAFNKGAEALLSKPFKLDDLISVVSRNTLPVETRFVDPAVKGATTLAVNFEGDLASNMASRLFQIGRGGMTLHIGTERKKIEMSQIMDFDFKFTDISFRGTAICRWIKLLDAGQKAILGLEFLNLDPETLAFFVNHWKLFPTITYMPIA